MAVPAARDLTVRTSFEISVDVNDRIYRPIIHRYLDLLIGSLKSTIAQINFATVANINPCIYIQNIPINLQSRVQFTGKHTVQTHTGNTQINLGEFSGSYRDKAQDILGADYISTPPYTSRHAATYAATNRGEL